MEQFEGTDSYIATDDLMMAVNAALTLERLDRGMKLLSRTH